MEFGMVEASSCDMRPLSCLENFFSSSRSVFNTSISLSLSPLFISVVSFSHLAIEVAEVSIDEPTKGPYKRILITKIVKIS